MCVGMFLVLLDVTIVNVALADIRRDLGVHAAGLEWVVDADTLGFATLMLTAGALGDAFGRRRLAVTGLVVFGAGSAVCGAAPALAVLLAGRALQGVGGALLLPQTLAVIAREYPEPAAQARAFGIWAGVSSLALPAGPLLGGVLVDRFGWPSVFLVNVPVVAVATLATHRLVRDDRRGHATRSLDARGQVLAIVGLGSVTAALVESSRLGWSSTVVTGALALGIVALAAFVHAERRARDPIVPLPWFRRREFAAPNAVGMLMNFGGVGMLYLVTLLLQVVQRRSALAAGVWIAAFTAPLALLAPAAGRLAARVGTRAPMVAGMSLGALGVSLFVAAGASSGSIFLLVGMALAGCGLALNTAPMVAAVMRSAPEARGAFASAVNNTARQVGAALGVAVLGGIAGDPGGASFVEGLHVAAVVTAIAWLAAAVVASLSVRVRVRDGTRARASARLRQGA